MEFTKEQAKKKSFDFCLIFHFLFVLLTSCISSPMPGLLYTNTTQHVYGSSPGGAKTNGNLILRTGESCSVGSVILINLIFYGSGGNVEEAMKSGGIQKVSVIDRRSRIVLGGLFYQECVVVWGE